MEKKKHSYEGKEWNEMTREEMDQFFDDYNIGGGFREYDHGFYNIVPESEMTPKELERKRMLQKKYREEKERKKKEKK